MDHDKKLKFIQDMTHAAMSHAASTPNVADGGGKMSHDKMLGFISKMTSHGLQRFDDGGTVLGGPSAAGNIPAKAQPTGLMGGISNILGTNNNFQANAANIQQGTNAGQLNAAYNGVQGALNQQQGALGQQQAMTSTLAGQANQGVGTQSALTNMLMQRATGGGPNPAQAQLNQATGQNIAQQAALAAGQRGAGANAGLIARQNAQQGAATQQNAVGQAATMNAQQQIAAQNQLQNLAGTQVGQGQGALNALTGASNAYGQAQQNEQGILQNANTSANNANVAMQSNINNVNSGVAAGNQAQNNNILGGITGALSGATAMQAASKAAPMAAMAAHGGVIQNYADGGWTNNVIASAGPAIEATQRPNIQQMDLSKPGKEAGAAIKKEFGKKDAAESSDDNLKQSEIGAQFAGNAPTLGIGQSDQSGPGLGVDTNLGGSSHVSNYFGSSDEPKLAQGGKVPAMVSAGEVYLDPEKVKQVLKGADPMKVGHHISGKAKVKDDSLKNDTIHAELDEGGIVIPRHITQHKMAPERAAAFVHRIAAKKRLH